MSKKPGRGASTRGMIKNGTIIGLLITLPSLAAFATVNYILEDMLLAAIAAAIVHMGFLVVSFRVSRILVERQSRGDPA